MIQMLRRTARRTLLMMKKLCWVMMLLDMRRMSLIRRLICLIDGS